ALLGALHALEVRSLLVEGGGVTAASFLAAGLVDRVTAYIAPRLIGGASAHSPLAGAGPASLADTSRLSGLDAVRIGSDLRLSARVLGPVG
ncbi:MAG: dihydrofolate reductase family protein, partial [Thermoanaerobaculia bacterium]|nr:dihydrofolate reductase family protein [Thermoanaerobaculia bacterium]